MQVVLVAAIVAGYAGFVYVTDRGQAEETARRQVTATALAVARSPSVVAAARSEQPTALLQPYADALTREGGVTFVVIMAQDGTRWTHPEPDRIGGTYLGHIGAAQRGGTLTETYEGTLGPSVRTVTPVWSRDRIVGLVSAGITIDRISAQVRRQVAALLGVAGGALALGGAGTYVINARLRRHTHGMNAAELSAMHDYHEAALHAVREGLVMLDGRRRVALVNDGARELLGIADRDVVGEPVTALGLPASLTGALLDDAPRQDELHLTADRVLVVSTRPVVGGRRRGTVATLRDHTELQALSGELDSERGFTKALRAQAHEAANRLHTVVSLIELGRADEAVGFATAELELAQVLTDRVVAAVGEPVLAALLLGKSAQASERGVELVLTEESRIDDGVLPEGLPSRDLVTVLGNLVDNAVEAAQGSDAPRVEVTARVTDEVLLLRVCDSGPGVADEDAEAVFRRGWSTRGDGRGIGLALVRQAAHRAGGTVELGRGPDGGAAFTVRLPLSAGRPAGQDASHAAGARPRARLARASESRWAGAAGVRRTGSGTPRRGAFRRVRPGQARRPDGERYERREWYERGERPRRGDPCARRGGRPGRGGRPCAVRGPGARVPGGRHGPLAGRRDPAA
nr:sensor histidine kinase [Streptomyces sp. CC210A]